MRLKANHLRIFPHAVFIRRHALMPMSVGFWDSCAHVLRIGGSNFAINNCESHC
jgi:hypothetical protein